MCICNVMFKDIVSEGFVSCAYIRDTGELFSRIPCTSDIGFDDKMGELVGHASCIRDVTGERLLSRLAPCASAMFMGRNLWVAPCASMTMLEADMCVIPHASMIFDPMKQHLGFVGPLSGDTSHRDGGCQ
jgi:hypothetical protein